MFIDHYSDLGVLVLHHLHELVERQAFRNRIDVANDQVVFSRIRRQAIRILNVYEADDVIGVVLIDRITREFIRAHDLEDLF